MRQKLADQAVELRAYRAQYKVETVDGVTWLTNKFTQARTSYGAARTVHFFDVETSLDLESKEARVYRLYQAAFNRKPDVAGLGFWIAQMRVGTPIETIAQQFLASREFETLYGKQVSVEAFVMAAYTNVLHRSPEAAGYDWWVAAVRQGVTRTDALIGFADSAENRDGLRADMVNGFDFAIPRRAGEPLLPQASSYLNKNNLPVTTTAMPGVADPSMWDIRDAQMRDGTLIGVSPRSLALGDFFRDGSITMFLVGTRYTNAYPNDNPAKWPDAPGYSYFLRQGPDGKWVDDTARLVPAAADRNVCIGSGYTLVADFNNDGAPDLFLSCTGIDFTLAGQWDDELQSSEQHLYLSKPDHTYQHRTLPIGRVYGHQATAADFDNNGTIDIVIVDPVLRKTPFVLWGNGDGNFVEDKTRMPADMHGKAIYGVVAVPINGVTTLLVSGVPPGSWDSANPALAYNTGIAYGTKALEYRNGRFEYLRDLTGSIPLGKDGRVYSLALDHVFHDGALYSLRVNHDYTEQGLIKTDWSTGSAKAIWSVAPLQFGNGFDQINLVNGKLMEFGAICNRYDITATLTCAYRIDP